MDVRLNTVAGSRRQARKAVAMYTWSRMVRARFDADSGAFGTLRGVSPQSLTGNATSFCKLLQQRANDLFVVMPGLVPGIHAFTA